jgi:hypothetical protein
MIGNAEERAKLQRLYSQITAKAWADPKYKARLLSDPAAVLGEAGVTTLDGRAVTVVENTPKLFHFVLLARPADLSDDQLASTVAACAESCVATECDICATE